MQGNESRRSSNITCCSSESSYLERRCSAITLGLTPLPPISSRKPSLCPSTSDMWDYYYPTPDIQVIQPTPKASPCPSERSGSQQCDGTSEHRRRRKPPKKSISEQESFDLIAVYPDGGNCDSGRHLHQQHPQQTTYDELEEEEIAETAVLAQQINKLSRDNRCLDDSIVITTQQLLNSSLAAKKLLLNRRAPLASLSSLKISSIDYQDSDLHSLGSDSVFAEHYADTDEDMEQFSTDSDEQNEEKAGVATSSNVSQRASRTNKTSAQLKRKSTVCADIELKPRELVIEINETNNTILDPNAQLERGQHQRLDYPTKSLSACDTSNVLKPQTINTFKRPASFSGLTRTTIKNVDSSNKSAEPNDSINNNNINKITKKDLTLINNSSCNYRNSRSTSNMDDELLFKPPQSSGPTFSSSFSPFNQQSDQKSMQPSYYSSSNSNSECLNKCKAIKSPIQTTTKSTVSDNRQRQSTSIDSPSVILELPVITQPQDTNITVEIEPPYDPSVPGPSRKWSKETLF